MLLVFVTGVSGSGKSTLARTMAGWGHRTVSTDADPGLCYWSDPTGCPVQRPAEPDASWLTMHEWRWNVHRLDEIISEAASQSDHPLWLFGQAANAADFADRFDVTILLEVDQQTMITRIQNASRGNDFGRVGDSLSIVLAAYMPFVTAWRRHGAVIVDGTADVETVAEELLMVAASAALQRRKPSD